MKPKIKYNVQTDYRPSRSVESADDAAFSDFNSNLQEQSESNGGIGVLPRQNTEKSCRWIKRKKNEK